LGQDNIDRGIRATVVGYCSSCCSSAFIYRLFGVLADLALAAESRDLIALMSRSAFSCRCRHRGLCLPWHGRGRERAIFERIREELNNATRRRRAFARASTRRTPRS